MRTITFLSLLVFAMLGAMPVSAALQGEGFMRDFKASASESHSFTRGKLAPFYKNTDDEGYGVKLNGVLASNDRAVTLASGLSGNSDNGMVDLERRAKLTTLLVNGTFDFHKRVASSMPVRPYLLGGVGVALYDTGAGASLSEPSHTAVVPVVRVGGGLAYRMGEDWDLSVSYKVGFAGSGDSLRGGAAPREATDLQMVDMGLKYKF